MAHILKIKNENDEWVHIPAIKGLDAYELAVKNGFAGTLQEWFESLKGADGTMIFEDLTEEQKESLKGDKGDKGDNGEPFTYEDFTPEQLEGLKGPDGRSAYEIAVEQGFSGTEAEWLDSLKGDKGDKGEDAEIADGSITVEKLADGFVLPIEKGGTEGMSPHWALMNLGAAFIEVGSYDGVATDNTILQTISFSFVPEVIFITGYGHATLIRANYSYGTANATSFYGSTPYDASVTWGPFDIAIRDHDNSHLNLTKAGEKFFYTAIGYSD